MKKSILIILSMALAAHCVSAQNTAKPKSDGQIGVSYSALGENDVIQSGELIGGPSYNGNKFYSIGITYLKPLNNWLDMETGLEYSKQTITITSGVMPYVPVLSYNAGLSLVSIPVTVRANFLKYFFVNGGLAIDFDTSSSSPITSQSGIGATLGFGVTYDFRFGGTVFVNPYSRFHNLLPFSTANDPQRLLETGVRVGIAYRL